MNMIKSLSFVLLILYSACNQLLAENRTHLWIKLPENIDLKYLIVTCDNGLERYPVVLKPSQRKDSIFIDEPYSTIYLVIVLKYKNKNNPKSLIYSNRFFVQNEPACIIFKTTGNDVIHIFDHYTLSNVKDFIEIKKRRDAFVAAEWKPLEKFMDENEENIFVRHDSAIYATYLKLNTLANNKFIEFYKKNSNNYFTFYYFKEFIAKANYIPTTFDSLLYIFEHYFPRKYINSFEGKELTAYLKSRLWTPGHAYAPDFSVSDIKGNTISLDSMKRKNWILISFWASWCSPCIAEIPQLKEIYADYHPLGLEIISLAHASSEINKIKSIINERKLDWPNIKLSDNKIVHMYGDQPIPFLLLLDRKGMIIHIINEERRDPDFKQLKYILDRQLRPANALVK